MPISTITKKLKMTPRRARKILREIQEGGGVRLSTRADLMALGNVVLKYEIQYDPTVTNHHKIAQWFQENFPNELDTVQNYSDEPKVGFHLFIEDIKRVAQMTRKIRQTPFIKALEEYLMYPPYAYVQNFQFRYLFEERLEQLLSDAGL